MRAMTQCYMPVYSRSADGVVAANLPQINEVLPEITVAPFIDGIRHSCLET